MSIIQIKWPDANQLPPFSYVCYSCELTVSSDKGYHGSSNESIWFIYICSHCWTPNAFFSKLRSKNSITPLLKPLPEFQITNVKEDVEVLFSEAKQCMSHDAYTAVAMICRKLLMNIAVDQGAETNKKFKYYADHLKNGDILSKPAKDLLEAIREIGNDANHEISQVTEDKAKLILRCTYEVINQIYMVSNYLPKKQPDQKTTTKTTN